MNTDPQLGPSPRDRFTDRIRELELELENTRTQLQLYARDFGSLARANRQYVHQLEELERRHRRSDKIASPRGGSDDLVSVAESGARETLATWRQDLQREKLFLAEVERAHYETVWRLTKAAQLKADELSGHLERISRLARVLARELAVSDSGIEVLAAAAPLHDIGKIGLSDSILRKTSPLSEDEWGEVRRHPQLGAEILDRSSSRLLQAATEIALTHHERWDGSGYPRGLSGSDIPLFGRIVMLVDQYDALRSRRPYKDPLDHDAACRTILQGDGRTLPQHFDPAVWKGFGSVASSFAEICSETPSPALGLEDLASSPSED